MKPFDYLIVGSGPFGCVFAHEASKKGKRCLVIDKRPHTGGNLYCEDIEGINVHKYGAHIFHTNNKEVWDYVNLFVEFNNYINSPLAIFKNELFNLPFNMNTFYKLWGIKTPKEAESIIKKQIKESGILSPTNCEEQAILMVGTDIYEKLIKEYTEKQWGRLCKDLPPFIIRRLPIRFTFDNNYFSDKFQGIPIGGYNKLIENLLKGIEVKTSADYFADREYWNSITEKIVYTGPLDEFYDFKFGSLEYRSLHFENKILPSPNYQGNAVVNYIEKAIPYTRIIEHKHFEFGTQPSTVITYEYSKEWKRGNEHYYPINDRKNEKIATRYKELSAQNSNVIFGGRLAEYKYYNMDQVIEAALNSVRNVN